MATRFQVQKLTEQRDLNLCQRVKHLAGAKSHLKTEHLTGGLKRGIDNGKNESHDYPDHRFAYRDHRVLQTAAWDRVARRLNHRKNERSGEQSKRYFRDSRDGSGGEEWRKRNHGHDTHEEKEEQLCSRN